MKIGRFVVDGHIHGSTLYRPAGKPKKEQTTMEKLWAEIEPYDNSEAIVYDMDAYGINMGVLKPSFAGTRNEMQAQIVDKYPNRFRAECMALNLRLKCVRGEAEWNIKDALAEIESVLTSEWGKGRFVGIGEFAPGGMGVVRKRPSYQERSEEFHAIAELAEKYDISVDFHEYETGSQAWWGPGAYEGLALITEVAAAHPNTRFVIMHGGGQYPEPIRMACEAISLLDNIWLETGYWRAEYYEFALKHTNLGATRLIWGGGDTGSSLWSHFPTQPGNKYLNPTGFWLQKKWPIPLPYQPDWYGWPTHQIHRLKDLELATQDEINLIVGGNAAKVYKLPVPMDRMFACGRPDLHGIHWEESIPWVPKEQVQKSGKP
jgi:predicted TIM-barrel fold metal-dependent hydrolase